MGGARLNPQRQDPERIPLFVVSGELQPCRSEIALSNLDAIALSAHAKTYHDGVTWYTLELDYARIFRTLLDAGFSGYCSIEMEGAEDAQTAMPKSIAMLGAAWAEAID